MTESDPELDRLADAIDAYMEHQASGADSAASADAMLDRHDHVRDLLEPMLRGPGEGDDSSDSGSGPQYLGDYRVVREIGRGGMGVVYEAMEESLGRRVALKVLPAHMTLSARQIERFHREASAAAKLEHEGIVRIHAVGEQEGTHFIAMEFREGRNLRDVLRDQAEAAAASPTKSARSRLGSSTLSVGGASSHSKEVAALVRSVAEGLAYAHERGVLHRDIKPQNLLIDDQGLACIVDFGLAKDLDAEALSMTGDFVGTPQYISPEQAESRAAIDGRSDVFSLGVVLYEMLTLSRPFQGETAQAVLEAVARDEPRPVRSVHPEVPRDLETICAKAMEKNPHRRYTAQGLAEELTRFLKGEPILARRVGWMGRLGRFARRRPAATVACVFGFLLLVAAPVAASFYFKSSRDALLEERGRTEQQRDLARANLRQARRVLDTSMRRLEEFQLGQRLGMQDLWRRILNDSKSYYERFVTDSAELGMDLELARAWDRIATIQINLGEHRAAFENCGKSAGTYRSVLKAETEGLEMYRFELGMALVNRAIAAHRGDLPRCDADLDEGIQLLKQTMESPLQERGVLVRFNLALALQFRAQVREDGDPKQRRQMLDEAFACWDAAEAERPDHPRFLGRREVARIDRALFMHQQGEAAASIRDYRLAITNLLAHIEEHPELASLRGWVAEAARGLMWCYHATGDGKRSSAFYEVARTRLDTLVTQLPENVEWRAKLAQLRADRSDLLVVGKRGAAMSKLLKAALPENEKAVKAYPQHSMLLIAYARLLKNQATLEVWRTKRVESEIVRSAEAAMAAWRRVVARRPKSSLPYRELAGTINNLGNWFMLRDPPDPGRALEYANQAIELQRQAVVLDPRDHVARGYLRTHLKLIQQAAGALGQSDVVATATAELRQLEQESSKK